MIELKPDYFYYCDKKYTQRRFMSRDLKLFITADDGFKYVTCYRANKEGKGIMIEDDGMYHENCSAAYPLYSIESALDKIKELGLTFEHEFVINPSHYKGSSKVTVHNSTGDNLHVKKDYVGYMNSASFPVFALDFNGKLIHFDTKGKNIKGTLMYNIINPPQSENN